MLKMQATTDMIHLKDIPNYLNPTCGTQRSFNPQVVVPLDPNDPRQRLKFLDKRGKGLGNDPLPTEPEVQQVANDDETGTRFPGDPLPQEAPKA